MVTFCQLLAQSQDWEGYNTLVFLNLDKVSYQFKYIMCVKFPNWNSDSIKIGDEGYLHYEDRKAGIDEWYDGTKMVKYNYDSVQFIKFVPKPKDEDKEIYLI